MAWLDLPDTTREIAHQELTPRQLQVLQHRLNGHSWRTIAQALNIHEATARGHHRAALAALAPHLRKDAA